MRREWMFCFFLGCFRLFFSSKQDFLLLFRFQRFKVKRLEEKCFAMNYFSFIKPGGEFFHLSMELFFSFGFSASTSGNANLIWDRLSVSHRKFWIQSFAWLCSEVLNLQDWESEGLLRWCRWVRNITVQFNVASFVVILRSRIILKIIGCKHHLHILGF